MYGHDLHNSLVGGKVLRAYQQEFCFHISHDSVTKRSFVVDIEEIMCAWMNC